MLHPTRVKSTMTAATTACLVSFSGLSLAGPPVLGPLQIKDTATIHSDGTKLTLENTEYAYFSGDRLVTSDKGSAILQLDEGFALFAPGTDAVVTREKGAYQVDLEAGGARIALKRNAKFVIRAADLTIEPFETEIIKTASGEAAIDVAVSIKDGKPSVFVKSGRVNVTSQGSGQFQTIAAGELYTASQSEGALRRVAIGEAGGAGVAPIIYGLLAAAAGLSLLESDSSSPGTTITNPPTTTEGSPFRPPS